MGRKITANTIEVESRLGFDRRKKRPGDEVVLFNEILQLQFFSTFSSLLFHQELMIPPSANDTMSEYNELEIYHDAF